MVVFLEFLKNWGGLILSAIAIVFTAITLPISIKAYKLQNRVNKLDTKIKQYELDKIKKEQDEENIFELGASVIKVGKHYRLKVFNIGKRTAYNVSAKIEGNMPMLMQDKMPFEELEYQRSFEETLIYYDNAPTKFKVIITWQDEKNVEYTKTQMCSI